MNNNVTKKQLQQIALHQKYIEFTIYCFLFSFFYKLFYYLK